MRRLCREYAQKWINVQRDEFKRLGVLGGMAKSLFESFARIRGRNRLQFGQLCGKKAMLFAPGSRFTGAVPATRPFSCGSGSRICGRDFSINICGLSLPDTRLAKVFPGADPQKAYAVIWTTTPWTIPDAIWPSARIPILTMFWRLLPMANSIYWQRPALRLRQNPRLAKL